VRALVATVLVLAAAAALAGCFGQNEQSVGDDSGAPPEHGVCTTDADCIGAGPSCCACAEYAVNADSDFAQACEDVDCPVPPPGTCNNVVPVCGADGACILGCAVVTCDQTCETGFAVDAAGCLTCECAPAPAAECAIDDDCTRVPADCCGCALGGADTAVPDAQVDAHNAGLGCPPDPVCPGVDVCTPGDVARCDMGRCVLGAAGAGLPAGACGTTDLPPCPAGQMCVLNSDDDANMEGVGVCQ
jgi:hypothetical protein